MKHYFGSCSQFSRYFVIFATENSLQQRVAPLRKHPNTTQPGHRFVHVLQQVPAPQSALRNSRFKIRFRQISKFSRFYVIFATEISLQQRVAPLRKHPNTTQPGHTFVHVLQQVPAPQLALRNSRFKIRFRQISKFYRDFRDFCD